MERYFYNLPIRRKLVLVTVATCSAALILASAALFWFQSVQFHRSFATELESLAAVVAENCDAPLTFKDEKSAAAVLASLRVQPQIAFAALLDVQGRLFARFSVDGAVVEVKPFDPRRPGVIFADGFGEISMPIMDGDTVIGTLHLRAHFEDRYRRLLAVYGGVLLAVLAGALVVILLLSSLMKRLIANPIVKLAEVAGEISDRQDYSRRAPEAGGDEVGELTRTFNRMLDQIQSRDSRLRESQQRYEVAVQGSSDGLWDWDMQTKTVYFAPRWKSMLGYEEHEVADSFDAFRGLLHPDDLSRVMARVDEYLNGRTAFYEVEFRLRRRDGGYSWILSRGAALRDDQGKPIRFAGSHTDITQRKEAEVEMARLHKEFAAASRQAGMAEVATGVLHNVGNVLNSVNVSAGLVIDQVRRSRIGSLTRALNLLRERHADLGVFLTTDPKGRQIPGFLDAIGEELGREHSTILGELEELRQNIEHIKQIVAMQQSYARVSGALERVPPAELVHDALRMVEDGLARHQIEVVRRFEPVADVLVDRHKVLQILVNLIGNAKHAVETLAEGRRITVSVGPGDDQRVRVEVQDNGMGIPPENLKRIFQHGFTTKQSGHGFGLHSGALAAKEMGGQLTAQSEGPGTGATFILELPLPGVGGEQTRSIRRAA